MTSTQELREDITRWLENSQAVQNRLGSDGSIVPVARAADDSASPQVAVGASLNSVERQNTRSAVSLEARVVVSGTFDWAAATTGAVDELTRLQDAVVDELTQHRDGWQAGGVTDSAELSPNDTVSRYLGATSFAFERTEVQQFYK